MVAVSGGVLGPGDIRVSAHLEGDLDSDLGADLSWHLSRVLSGNLVALLLDVLVALWS